MKDKFCVSKTLAYLVLLVGAVAATFFATNYANNQKLTSISEAANNCKEISCGTIVFGATSKFYVKNGNYFEDNSCNKELTQGVGNYCRGNKTAAGNDLCLKETCSNNPNRVYYKKAGKFYGDSSCTGTIGRTNYCTIPPTTPGSGTSIACLSYSCTSIDKGISGRFYSVQQGTYFADQGCVSELYPLVGVNKYCRGAYVKFSCYNWWNAFDARDTTGTHATLLTDLNRSKAVYTNNNGISWYSDNKGATRLVGSAVHDFCTSK